VPLGGIATAGRGRQKRTNYLGEEVLDADGRDGSRVGARQRADRRAGGRRGWRRAACHSLLPRARIARRSARPRVYPGTRAARPSSPARVPAARRATHRAGRLQPRGLPGAAHVSTLAAAARGAGWPPRARLRVRHGVVKLLRMRLTPARRPALAVPAAAGAAAPLASPPSPPGIMDAFAKHPPIAVAGHVGEALGGQQASLLQLFDLGVHHADPTVRAEAARIVIGTIDTDSSLRASVLAQLNAMDDAALGALFRGMAGDNAQEVAMQIMTTARTSAFRSKASAVLQQLRQGG